MESSNYQVLPFQVGSREFSENKSSPVPQPLFPRLAAGGLSVKIRMSGGVYGGCLKGPGSRPLELYYDAN